MRAARAPPARCPTSTRPGAVQGRPSRRPGRPRPAHRAWRPARRSWRGAWCGRCRSRSAGRARRGPGAAPCGRSPRGCRTDARSRRRRRRPRRVDALDQRREVAKRRRSPRRRGAGTRGNSRRRRGAAGTVRAPAGPSCRRARRTPSPRRMRRAPRRFPTAIALPRRLGSRSCSTEASRRRGRHGGWWPWARRCERTKNTRRRPACQWHMGT